ncbi:MAG TPA: hypothetical protein VK209_10015 [Candidatus Sulfotelmatobacter sp.]|nr:hypothetical protein [Candidatus Sulfotelmatobacter sp.]
MRRRDKFASVAVLLLCLAELIIIDSVMALEQTEASTFETWSAAQYYQGDSGEVTIRLVSNCSEQLKIYFIGIHFDWMEEEHYYTASFYIANLETNPAIIQRQGEFNFGPVDFDIPTNVSVGYHSYYILIDGQQERWKEAFWKSTSKPFMVNDGYPKIYREEYPQTAGKINICGDLKYQNPEAMSLFQQAKDEFNQAESLAIEEKWQKAVNSLRNSRRLAEEAEAKEQTYQPQPQQLGKQQEQRMSQQTQQYSITVVTARALYLGLIVCLLIYFKKHKFNKTS